MLPDGATAGETEEWWQLDFSSQICTERPESNGVLKISEAKFVIKGGPGLILLGGHTEAGYIEAMLGLTARAKFDMPKRIAS